MLAMAEDESTLEEREELRHGLPMVSRWDPEALAAEKAELAALKKRGLLTRFGAYAKRMGPGWMQSAIALGSGSAFSSLFAGALLGYSLIWVQPVGMVLGVVMLIAIAWQTLSTGARPFDAMRTHVHWTVAWAWAAASLAATVIWHLPQYSCGAGVVADLAEFWGWEGASTAVYSRLALGPVAIPVGPKLYFGLGILLVSILVTWFYGSGSRGIRFYERLLKVMVGAIVLAFLLVVLKTGVDWGALWDGLRGHPRYVPGTALGVSVMMGSLSACVGINMTFLLPYSMLAKGWGREHRELAIYDLVVGLCIPFILVTGLLVIAAANTLHDPANPISTKVTPWEAARVLQDVAGPAIGRVVFDLGVLAMCLSSITLHMLVSAFIACEVLGVEPTGWRYRLAVLIPTPAFLGCVLWAQVPLWLPVVTSAICGLLLPIAYIGFFILHNKRAYMGEARPRGVRGLLFNAAMLVAILFLTGNGVYYIYVKCFGG
jgi:Mn2+/Fe2+ NRAMP family transporter